jgi:23S rRNA U2552 (ribose-2'-O)-methylase RlmE/FtsJ
MNVYTIPTGSINIKPDHIRIRFKDENDIECFISTTLSSYLNKVKKRINDYPTEWDNFKRITNTYEYIHTVIPKSKYSISKVKPLSRAFFKLIEIYNLFDIYDDSRSMNSFHLAEGPGGFIEAMTYLRFNDKDKYIGMTLVDSENDNVPGWEKSSLFLRKNPNIFIEKGGDNTGNLYSAVNLDQCNTLYRGSMDLITADGGFDFSVDFNKQELLAMRLIFSEVIYAIVMQKIGGSFILKLFDTFLKGTVDIIFLLSCLYESVQIIKPNTSRIANSERYIVCTNFKRNVSNDLIAKFRAILVILDNLKINTLAIDSLLNIPIPYYFKNRIEEINAIIASQQIDNIQSTLRFIENKERKGEKLQQIKNSNIEKCITWCEVNNIPYNKNGQLGNIFKSDINKKISKSPFHS